MLTFQMAFAQTLDCGSDTDTVGGIVSPMASASAARETNYPAPVFSWDSFFTISHLRLRCCYTAFDNCFPKIKNSN